MPSNMAYQPGGKHPGKSSTHLPGEGASDIDVTTSGAGMGTGYNGPNCKPEDAANPGGYGSTGSASDSSPSGG